MGKKQVLEKIELNVHKNVEIVINSAFPGRYLPFVELTFALKGALAPRSMPERAQEAAGN